MKYYSPKYAPIFVVKKVKNTVPWTYINSLEFRIKKAIKRKGDKLYVKWKGYDISFNSWIDTKDIV